MTEQENVQLIQELHAAFGRGDEPAILRQLTGPRCVVAGPAPPPPARLGPYLRCRAPSVGCVFGGSQHGNACHPRGSR